VVPAQSRTSNQMGSNNEAKSATSNAEAIEVVCGRLAYWCGIERTPAQVRDCIREAAASGAAPLDSLAAAVVAVGLKARPVSLTLAEVVHHARSDTPIVLRRPNASPGAEWLIVVRRGWFRVRVDGLDRLGRTRDVTVGALEKLLGGGDGPISCLLVEAALPADAVGPAGMPSDSVGALGKEHFQAHVHPSPLDRVRSLARLEQKDLWTLFWYAVATGLLYLAIPLAVDAMVSNIAFGGQQRVYVQALLVLAAVLGTFLFLYASIRALAFVVIERLQRRLFVRFTADLAARLPKVTQAEFDKVHGPELTNRFFDIMTLQKAAAQLLLDGLDVILSFLIGSLVLAFYDWTLFWFDAGLLVLIAVVIRGFGRGGVNSSIEESRAKYATAGWLQQVALFSGAFKSPGGEALAEARADSYAREYLKHRRTHFKILFRQVVGLLAIEVVATTALLLWGGFLVLSGKLSIGQLVASELILTATLAASAKFGKQLETAYDLLTAVDKIGHLVDLRMERSGGSSPNAPAPTGASVQVRGLHFGYSADRPVFRGLDVSIESGARIALFARASTGSTTLLDILYGLRSPSEGLVEVDGLDLRQWNLESLRTAVARVAADDSIFDGTVRENVQMGNETVGVAEVVGALRAVGLLRKIQALPRGVDEPIALLGRSLSGTERRQVLLARAIARAPRLLLLDGTLDGFEAEEIDSILSYIASPERPWTLLVVTRDPDVLRRFERQLTLPERSDVRKEAA
jgi:putative ABC transport system ATP-binding protein